jgi:hypothetical protein
LTQASKGFKEPCAALIGSWLCGLRDGTHKGRSYLIVVILNVGIAVLKRTETCIAATCAAADGITFLRNQRNALNAGSLWRD